MRESYQDELKCNKENKNKLTSTTPIIEVKRSTYLALATADAILNTRITEKW